MLKERFIILKMEGKILDIMCEVNPEQKNKVHMENELRAIYLHLLKLCMGAWSLHYYGTTYTQKN